MKKTLLTVLAVLLLIVVGIFYRRGEQAIRNTSQETTTGTISGSENGSEKTEEEKVVYPISGKCPDAYEKVGGVCYPACPIGFVVEEKDGIDYYGNTPRSCIEDLTYLADKIESQKQLSGMTEHIGLITSIFKSGDSYSMSIDYVDVVGCAPEECSISKIKNVNKRIRTFTIADDVLISTMYIDSCEKGVDEEGNFIGRSQYNSPHNFPDFLVTRESCKNYPRSNTKAQPYNITLDKNNVVRIIESVPLSS